MRLRLAPSPAGLLHIGDARIALATDLHARRHGGTCKLRIDDADPDRRNPDLEAALEHDLRWLGIGWEAVLRQSERLDRYAAAADRLRANGRLYPCFESDEELNAKREQRLKRGLAPIYDRAMLKLTPEQRAHAEAGGKRPYWRFLLTGRTLHWTDLILGAVQVKLSAISDPIVIRADGTPLYAFTAAIDDLDEAITDLVRGEDQVPNTAVQLDLMAALAPNAPLPRLAHLPALTDDDGAKLTKRSGSLTVRGLRSDGIEPAALTGHLATIGTPHDPAPGLPDTIAPTWALSSMAHAPARFDGQTLLALNRLALRNLPFEAVQDRLPPAATPAFWAALRGNIDLLNEARGWWDVVAGSIVPPLLAEDADYLQAALQALPPEPWNNDVWRLWIDQVKAETGRKGKRLFMPLRQALTGEDHGPDLRDLLPLMGRSRTAERLRLAAT